MPLGTKDKRFGKWSPTWYGPYKIGRCQVSYRCQWSTPQEVLPEHVGKRVTKADETHLAILRKANTLSWPAKKMR